MWLLIDVNAIIHHEFHTIPGLVFGWLVLVSFKIHEEMVKKKPALTIPFGLKTV